jgi:hypothetical protein
MCSLYFFVFIHHDFVCCYEHFQNLPASHCQSFEGWKHGSLLILILHLYLLNVYVEYNIHCQPLNRFTFGLHKHDNNKPLIQLTDMFLYFQDIRWPAISDCNKQLIQLSLMQLSDGHCNVINVELYTWSIIILPNIFQLFISIKALGLI